MPVRNSRRSPQSQRSALFSAAHKHTYLSQVTVVDPEWFGQAVRVSDAHNFCSGAFVDLVAANQAFRRTSRGDPGPSGPGKPRG
jgi:hypothetical protein